MSFDERSYVNGAVERDDSHVEPEEKKIVKKEPREKDDPKDQDNPQNNRNTDAAYDREALQREKSDTTNAKERMHTGHETEKGETLPDAQKKLKDAQLKKAMLDESIAKFIRRREKLQWKGNKLDQCIREQKQELADLARIKCADYIRELKRLAKQTVPLTPGS